LVTGYGNNDEILLVVIIGFIVTLCMLHCFSQNYYCEMPKNLPSSTFWYKWSDIYKNMDTSQIISYTLLFVRQ